MIIFFGPPGSGKSMQGQIMAARHGWRWISTGELLRQTNDPAILEIQQKGELVTDGIVNKLFFEAIGDDNNVILDGYPRNSSQAETLIEKYGSKISMVIVLRVTNEEIEKRLALRQRAGDDVETVLRRVNQYDEMMQPIIDYLKNHGVTIEYIDGVQSVGKIHDEIEAVLERDNIVGIA